MIRYTDGADSFGTNDARSVVVVVLYTHIFWSFCCMLSFVLGGIFISSWLNKAHICVFVVKSLWVNITGICYLLVLTF